MSYSVGGQGAPGNSAASRRSYSQQQLGAKVEMVYGLLSMLGTHDREDMSRTLLAMSSSPDSCVAMRQSGCLPLLVQLLYGRDQDPETRARAAQALHNIVNSNPDEKRGRREARVLRSLQLIRIYCDELSSAPKPAPPHGTCLLKEIVQALSSQKVLSGSGRATRRWSMYFPIRRSLPTRLEPDNTFWDDSTSCLKSIDRSNFFFKSL